MVDRKPCRGCENADASAPAAPPNYRPGVGRWVTQDVLASRLGACRECDSLLAETTCAHCGCLVAYSATLRDKRCPYPGDDRWVCDAI